MPTRQRLLILISAVCTVLGILWLWIAHRDQQRFAAEQSGISSPITVNRIESGMVAAMDSAGITYSPAWIVDARGADPHEPNDPWTEPSGVVTFDYIGQELALQVATGNYWGYFYVTVDGQPANLLPTIAGNLNHQQQNAAYKTFYEPERQLHSGPDVRWLRIHRAAQSLQSHRVRIEVWRSWGQIPLRAIAVDAMPTPPYPSWPGVGLIVLAVFGLSFALSGRTSTFADRWHLVRVAPVWMQRAASIMAKLLVPNWPTPLLYLTSLMALILIASGVATDQWFLCLGGIIALAYLALQCPALWVAALLFGLPFYFSFTLPLLPGRSLSLIDIGVLGGVVIVSCRRILEIGDWRWGTQAYPRSPIFYLLALIVGWSLVSTFAAEQFGVALREWRTVFFNAGLFALVLSVVLRISKQRTTDIWILIGTWLAGSTVVSLVGLWQYVSDTMLITAEGVYRVRAFYGSPNNLALYLDRTVAVTLSLALFLHSGRWRLLLGMIGLIQVVVLLLTFSKGAIFLGLPMTLLVLAVGGYFLLRWQKRSLRPLWWLVGLALLAILFLSPSLAAERFQRLFDFDQGTGFLRLLLWRSSWQMAWDHLLLGVGPDNFLYTFRSGYILPAAWQEPNLNHPHNWILDWWTRLGTPGLLLAITFWGMGLVRLAQQLYRGIFPALSLGLMAAGLAALAHGLIDVSYALPDLMLVWVLIFGVAVAEAKN